MNRSTSNASASGLIESGREVIQIEAAAVSALEPRLNETFAAACGLLLACRGRVVVTGMGKSGIICRKIAATLASTGSPAATMPPKTMSRTRQTAYCQITTSRLITSSSAAVNPRPGIGPVICWPNKVRGGAVIVPEGKIAAG